MVKVPPYGFIVIYRVGNSTARIRTNDGDSVQEVRRRAEAAGYSDVVVRKADAKDSKLRYVYLLGEEDY